MLDDGSLSKIMSKIVKEILIGGLVRVGPKMIVNVLFVSFDFFFEPENLNHN